ncbi:hypothetical protein [Amycolatopsis sp. GM8]|uniref:hypothetical protein n=1 Tax=Amycolatopsis sp. GM8 TaxID=2896530 RepID=UPI001F2A3706|nr:hypothetical protein [Amycolatopsis sp. GM8]
MRRLLVAIPAALLLASCAAAPAPAPSSAPPPPSVTAKLFDSAPVIRTLLTAADAAKLGFTTDPAAQAVTGSARQLIGACKTPLPSDARIEQAQTKDWYTGDPTKVAVSLHQESAQYAGVPGTQVIDELRAAGGCLAGMLSTLGPSKAIAISPAPGVDAGIAFAAKGESPFFEQNSVVVLAHGDMVTEATLDVSGGTAAAVISKAGQDFGTLVSILAAAMAR